MAAVRPCRSGLAPAVYPLARKHVEAAIYRRIRGACRHRERHRHLGNGAVYVYVYPFRVCAHGACRGGGIRRRRRRSYGNAFIRCGNCRRSGSCRAVRGGTWGENRVGFDIAYAQVNQYRGQVGPFAEYAYQLGVLVSGSGLRPEKQIGGKAKGDDQEYAFVLHTGRIPCLSCVVTFPVDISRRILPCPAPSRVPAGAFCLSGKLRHMR